MAHGGVKGVEILEAGYEITVADLKEAMKRQRVTLGAGDGALSIVLIPSDRVERAKLRGRLNSLSASPAPILEIGKGRVGVEIVSWGFSGG